MTVLGTCPAYTCHVYSAHASQVRNYCNAIGQLISSSDKWRCKEERSIETYMPTACASGLEHKLCYSHNSLTLFTQSKIHLCLRCIWDHKSTNICVGYHIVPGSQEKQLQDKELFHHIGCSILHCFTWVWHMGNPVSTRSCLGLSADRIFRQCLQYL